MSTYRSTFYRLWLSIRVSSCHSRQWLVFRKLLVFRNLSRVFSNWRNLSKLPNGGERVQTLDYVSEHILSRMHNRPLCHLSDGNGRGKSSKAQASTLFGSGICNRPQEHRALHRVRNTFGVGNLRRLRTGDRGRACPQRNHGGTDWSPQPHRAAHSREFATEPCSLYSPTLFSKGKSGRMDIGGNSQFAFGGVWSLRSTITAPSDTGSNTF